MDTANTLVDNLTSNTQMEREAQLATDLQSYAAENHLSYSIEITDNNNTVPPAELDSHMNKTLLVKISTGSKTTEWRPLNNKNIYILLRE